MGGLRTPRPPAHRSARERPARAGSLGAKRLAKIEPADVRGARVDCLASGLSRNIVINCLRVLALILEQAVADGKIACNPAAAQGRERLMLQLAHAEMDVLERHEIGGYLTACSSFYGPLTETLAHGDARRRGLCARGGRRPARRVDDLIVNRSRKKAAWIHQG